MSVKRSIGELRGAQFFEPGGSIYVNRAVETFELFEHRHDFVELTYVSEGSGVHYINGEAITVSKGDAFFLPVGVTHVFRPSTATKDRKLIVYNCVLDTKFLSGLPALFPDSSDILSAYTDGSLSWQQVRDSGEFQPMFVELYREYAGKSPGYRTLMTTLVVRILIGLYRRTYEDTGSHAHWGPVSQAVAYMEANFRSNELSLTRLAAEAKLSERQFSRLFRKQVGMSYLSYLHNLRIDAACRMLKTSLDSVASIASAVGYMDLKFFHRLFKRKTGLTPRQYRSGLLPDRET